MKSNPAVIVFVRHPELGKVKTRLAATIGNEKALAVYKFLLAHTFEVVKNLELPVFVFYAEKIEQDDIWTSANIIKRLQQGKDLGERMTNAFKHVFDKGYSKVVIIGSDCYELTTLRIREAIDVLNIKQVVIGPAKDGGYYLLGMVAPFKDLFQNIVWSTDSVLQKTIEKLEQNKYHYAKLAVLNDVDTEQDINFTY